jgi:hypothetical protein
MNERNSQHWTSDQEKLEAFLFHQIDEKNRDHLAAHLEQCNECRQVVQKEKELIAGIRQYGRREMKLRLKQLIQNDQRKRFDWTQVASLAAAVVLMLGAVFAIRWFTDFEHTKTRTHEIALKSDEPSHRSLWITGKVVVRKRMFHGTLSQQNSSFLIKQGNITQIVSISHASVTELPSKLRTIDGSNIQTLLERTPGGLQLTLYTDIKSDTVSSGIEAITSDSLIVYLQGQQIAYHIPGGWAGRI